MNRYEKPRVIIKTTLVNGEVDMRLWKYYRNDLADRGRKEIIANG